MEYWSIVLENYMGGNETYYFENYEIAKESFERLCNKNSNKSEFEKHDDGCSWFDANYNEYSTFVWLTKTHVIIHKEPIDIE